MATAVRKPPVKAKAPTARRGKAPTKGKGGFLKRKVGPLPVWGWALGVVGALAIGLYLRHRAAAAGQSGQAAATAQPASDTGVSPGGGSGGGDPGSGSLGSDTGTGDLGTGDLGGTFLPAGAVSSPFGPDMFGAGDSSLDTGPSFSPAASAAVASPVANSDTATLANGAILRFNPTSGIVTEQAPGKSAYRVASGITSLAAYMTRIGKVTANPNKAAGRSAAGGAAAPAQSSAGAHGGVAAISATLQKNALSVKTLANGAKLYSYAGGRQVEQAPGKKAYVVKKGK